jgi:hypothetical protein
VATNLAETLPVAVGLKTSDMVQLALAARDVPQVLAEIENSLALVPEKRYELTEIAIALVFLTVSTCAAEAAPALVVGKVMLAGENEIVG